MKRLLFLLLLACVSFLGCDENVDIGLVAEHILSEQASAVQTTIPEDVLAAMKHHADRMNKHREYALGPPPDPRYNSQAVIDNFIETKEKLLAAGIADLDYHELQKAYYKKYIDAGGIAIVAPAHVEDVFMIGARNAILVMTFKHPELRERLSSKHKQFYMILVDDYTDYYDMPLTFQSSLVIEGAVPPIRWSGSCVGISGGGIDGQVGTDGKLQWIDYPPDGFCWASIPGNGYYKMGTFVHEFAHALEGEIAFLEPGFPKRVKEAYEQMLVSVGPDAYNYHAGGSAREFWAEGVTHWFRGEKGRKYLYDNFPTLADIIAEWFPKVELLEDKETVIPMWTAEDGTLWASGEEEIFHFISWKIVEE